MITGRGRFNRYIIGAAFALLAGNSASGQTSPDYELQKQWEVPFTLFRNWALCPDGSLYSLDDKQGGIKRTSADGKTDSENVGVVSLPASLLTCDQKNQLYIASNNRKELDIYSLGAQGKLAHSVSAREKFFLLGVVVTPAGNLYALSEEDSAPVIRQLSLDGRVLRKFHGGRSALVLPFLLFPYPQSFLTYRSRVFDWDEVQQRFLVDIGRFFSLESMDLKGHWERVRDPFSAGYGAPALVGLDRMFVWKGQYVAEVTFRSEIADVFNVTKLELLDRSFQPAWSRNLTQEEGLLVATAADGSLYFLRELNGTDCKLARYTLAQVEQTAQN